MPEPDLAVDAEGELVEGHLCIASFEWWTERFADAGFTRCVDVEERLYADIEPADLAPVLEPLRVPPGGRRPGRGRAPGTRTARWPSSDSGTRCSAPDRPRPPGRGALEPHIAPAGERDGRQPGMPAPSGRGPSAATTCTPSTDPPGSILHTW